MIKKLKCALLCLALTDALHGAEQPNEIELRTISVQGEEQQSPIPYNNNPHLLQANNDTIEYERKDVSYETNHEARELITIRDVKKILKHPCTHVIISLGIMGGFAVGGYFLIKHVYNNLITFYSYPTFSPQSGGWSSDCFQLFRDRYQNPCLCYKSTVPYHPPLDYGHIDSYLYYIQRNCNLSETTLERIGEHLNASWTYLNSVNFQSFISAQCQNESTVRDTVQVAYYPTTRVGNALSGYHTIPAHTDLIIDVTIYTASCLALNAPPFAGSIVGWSFACIFALIVQWIIFCCLQC